MIIAACWGPARAGHYVLPALLLLVPSAAAPQTPVPLTLTLDEAVTRGLEASHRVKEARAHAEAATAAADGREAPRRPQIAAQAGYTRTNHVDEFGVLLPNNQLRVIYPD